MKDQQQFMINLLDFSNLPSKRTQYDSTNLKGSQSKKTKGENINMKNSLSENYEQNELGMSNANESSQKLLQSFNSLREKLQSVQRENIILKEDVEQKTKQLSEINQKQTYFKSLINERNKKISSLQQQLIQYKRRLNSLKQSKEQIELQSSQLQTTKIRLSSVFQQNQRLKQELHKNMQISISQKLNLQEKLQYLKMKDIQSDKTLEEIENRLYQKNTDYIKLENQYKKLKIIYDQQIFSKKFTGERDILMKENQELKNKLDETQVKYRKEKNKKYQLQGKLLQLEEKVRLYGTKTDIYEGELQTISKKMKKVQKNHSQAKKYADAALQEKLSWEEKFYNSLIIAEQLISRVKRQLIGDAVELAKTSQFRLNKLKNDQKIDLPRKVEIKRNKSSSMKKLRSQSAIKKIDCDIEQKQKQEQMNICFLKNREAHKIVQKTDSFSKTVLKQINKNLILNNDVMDVKKNLFNQMNTPTKSQITVQKTKNKEAIQVESINLDAKIRKQRQLMERKLRQKILYNKIQDSTNENTKNRLRDQFFYLATMNL